MTDRETLSVVFSISARASFLTERPFPLRARGRDSLSLTEREKLSLTLSLSLSESERERENSLTQRERGILFERDPLSFSDVESWKPDKEIFTIFHVFDREVFYLIESGCLSAG